jgi:ABC-type iron transport system FetAB permease component
MNFLRWLGALILVGWLAALIFKVENNHINFLIVFAALMFFIDLLYNKEKTM